MQILRINTQTDATPEVGNTLIAKTIVPAAPFPMIGDQVRQSSTIGIARSEYLILSAKNVFKSLVLSPGIFFAI